MKNDIKNKWIETADEEAMYYSMFSEANVKVHTRIPLTDNLLYKGNLSLNGNTFYFNPEPLRKHTRNPIVFKSKHVTFRMTAEGNFTGTMRLKSTDFSKHSKARRLVVEVFEFVNLMIQQQTVNE